MPYTLEFDAGVLKDVQRLEAKIFRQVVMRILGLTRDPRPHDSEQIQGFRDPGGLGRKGFRLDQGEYRVLYLIHDTRKKVTIFRVAHRRDVYRNLPS